MQQSIKKQDIETVVAALKTIPVRTVAGGSRQMRMWSEATDACAKFMRKILPDCGTLRSPAPPVTT